MPLVEKLLLLAVLLQAVIPFVVLVRLRKARVKAFKEHGLTMEKIAVDHTAWPVHARQIQNSYANQFELPVLFYVVCLLAFHVGATGWIMAALAWGFALSRWVHMFIHCGSNRVSRRFMAFFIGMLVLGAMWIWLAIHVFVLL